MMLQQTRAETVVPYFERWLRAFPTVAALAAASEDDVLRAWEGLGYYSRARNLKRAAEVIVRVHDGKLPADVEALRSLPGIGRYSAGAIASLAFGERVPLVDGNVVRVLCRLFGLGGDPTRSPLQRQLWEIAEGLVPAESPGAFNEGLMELGATVCTPKSAHCRVCPLRRSCVAHREGSVEALPALPARPGTTRVPMGAAVCLNRKRILVVRMPEDAPRWRGMWRFPASEPHGNESTEAAAIRSVAEAAGLEVAATDRLQTVNFTVTRFRIRLDVYRCRPVSSAPLPSGGDAAWRRPAELTELAMPKADRAIARTLLD